MVTPFTPGASAWEKEGRGVKGGKVNIQKKLRGAGKKEGTDSTPL